WFEHWYNEEAGDELHKEAPIYVPYHFLSSKKTFDWPKPSAAEDGNLQLISTETKAAVAEILEQKLGRSLGDADLRPETTLDDLGLDSLDRMDLNLRIERRFGF